MVVYLRRVKFLAFCEDFIGLIAYFACLRLNLWWRGIVGDKSIKYFLQQCEIIVDLLSIIWLDVGGLTVVNRRILHF
jgi:hypothetical protein